MELLCSSVEKIAQKLAALQSEAQEMYTKFSSIFSKCAWCQILYDSIVMAQWSVEQLGKIVLHT